MNPNRGLKFLAKILISFGSIYALGLAVGPDIAALAFRSGMHWSVGEPPRELSLESFQTETSDHIKLSGWIRRSSKDAPVVVFVHGIFGDRRQMMHRANGLYDLDLNLVFFDLRGHGESSSAPRTFGISENLDVRAVVDWSRQNFPSSRIALFGYSLGAAAVLLGEGAPKVDAIIVEATFTTLAATLHNRVHLHVPLMPDVVEKRLLELVVKEIGVSAEDISPLEAISRTTYPTLVLAGGRDRYVLRDESSKLFASSSADMKDLFLDSAAGHNSIFAHDAAEYQRKITTFLEKVMGPLRMYRAVQR